MTFWSFAVSSPSDCTITLVTCNLSEEKFIISDFVVNILKVQCLFVTAITWQNKQIWVNVYFAPLSNTARYLG